MKQTRLLMGMPITVEIVEANGKEPFEEVYQYLDYIDHKFSTYKTDSEITQINKKEITPPNYSQDMKLILSLCQETKEKTYGFFDIKKNGHLDPSGLVKGWAINKAAKIILQLGFTDFYIEAGGDIQMSGKNNEGEKWTVGIRNPFNSSEIVKVLRLTNYGVATSGTYERGQHVYNPHQPDASLEEIVSLTVIGPNVYEADRFATAAFAMGVDGIKFIQKLSGFEGYQIDSHGQATITTNFERFVANAKN